MGSKTAAEIIHFRGLSSDIEKAIVNRNTDIHKEHVSWLKTREIVLKNSPIPLWSYGKAISQPKLKDLQSIMPLILPAVKQFYKNIVGKGEVSDDIEGYNAPLDFDVEGD
ncbi:hypothetical protein PR048_015677 [Dryococelus australis]|uniref:Uncharacterized protein n=1 Tax=Dryococelus australis TaxID=614101 RepID=A0ABQ9HHT8_9NEOP|nr:hypothetical protein PR048_015677 [Dryococelus australis]